MPSFVRSLLTEITPKWLMRKGAAPIVAVPPRTDAPREEPRNRSPRSPQVAAYRPPARSSDRASNM